MKFSLLNYRELNECRRTIENIDLDNIQSSDIDAIYKIAFHYLTTYHYCGRQKRHLTKAKQYFELPYVLNNDYLHITSLNIYKYLYEYDEAKSYCLEWKINEADYYQSKELYEEIAHDSLLMMIKNSLDKKNIYLYSKYSLNYLKLMIDNNYHIDTAIRYLIILYLFKQTNELYKYIFKVCKKYNLEYLKIFAKYVSNERRVLIEKELNNHNMTIHVEKDADYNYLKLDDFEYYLVNDFVFEINQIIHKDYYNPSKFISYYEDVHYYEFCYEFDSNMKNTLAHDEIYNYFHKVYNSILYKLYLNIIIKCRKEDRTFQLILIGISNYIYQHRFIYRYIENQNMLFADSDFNYDDLYDDILNILIKDYNFDSSKIYFAINEMMNKGILTMVELKKVVREVFGNNTYDTFEYSLYAACDYPLFRSNLEALACHYLWENEDYDEYLLIYKYLLELSLSDYDEVPSEIYYNIACYYLDSDESRFNLELGIEYFNKYKESEQDWEKNDNENNNLKKIIEEHKDK